MIEKDKATTLSLGPQVSSNLSVSTCVEILCFVFLIFFYITVLEDSPCKGPGLHWLCTEVSHLTGSGLEVPYAVPGSSPVQRPASQVPSLLYYHWGPIIITGMPTDHELLKSISRLSMLPLSQRVSESYIFEAQRFCLLGGHTCHCSELLLDSALE